MTCKPGSGSIVSKKTFGDAQIHVEFATPKADADAGQGPRQHAEWIRTNQADTDHRGITGRMRRDGFAAS